MVIMHNAMFTVHYREYYIAACGIENCIDCKINRGSSECKHCVEGYHPYKNNKCITEEEFEGECYTIKCTKQNKLYFAKSIVMSAILLSMLKLANL